MITGPVLIDRSTLVKVTGGAECSEVVSDVAANGITDAIQSRMRRTMASNDVEEIERSALDQAVGGVCEAQGQAWDAAGEEHARAIKAYTSSTDEDKAKYKTAEGTAQAAVKRAWQA